MTQETRAVEIPAELRPVLLAMAKNLLHHLYGPQGPPWGTSFADLEELVVQLSDTLSSELLHQALQRQAEQPVPEPGQTHQKNGHFSLIPPDQAASFPCRLRF